jgi:T5SS/PEP-CTERM-associated repeat protein
MKTGIIAVVPVALSATLLSTSALATIVTAGGVTPAPFNVAANKTVPALVIGTNANGSLVINSASVLTVTPGGTIFGDTAAATGTGEITGKGSLLTSKDDIDIGLRGTGDVSVRDCGAISSDKDIIIGSAAFKPGGTGELIVSGKCAGSTSMLKAGRDLVVGSNASTGTFLLQNGASANVTGNAFFGRRLLGDAGGTGTGNISGTGTVLTVGGDLRVGVGETGMLTIRSGGKATVGGSAFVGTLPLKNQPGNGTLNLDRGTLDVTGGGLLVGLDMGSAGSIDAVRSKITVKDTVFVGDTGSTAHMTVQVNSTLSAKSFVTDGAGKFLVTGRSTADFTGGGILRGTSSVTVDGPGSSITAGGDIITPNGTPTLNVLGGAKLTTTGSVSLGTAAGATGNVDGKGSVLKATDVVLGGAGTVGNLTISNDGKVGSPVTVNKGSTLTGRKGVDGKITNNGGTVVLAPGGLTDDASYVQTTPATLTTDLAGANAFGILNAAGTGTFGAGTALDFMFSFQPATGETFTFFDALGGINVAPSLDNCATDVFTCSFSGVPTGDRFEVESSPTALTLVTLSTVPEPAGLGVFGLGLAALGGVAAIGRRGRKAAA